MHNAINLNFIPILRHPRAAAEGTPIYDPCTLVGVAAAGLMGTKCSSGRLPVSVSEAATTPLPTVHFETSPALASCTLQRRAFAKGT
jgi:hypothetical protein